MTMESCRIRSKRSIVSLAVEIKGGVRPLRNFHPTVGPDPYA